MLSHMRTSNSGIPRTFQNNNAPKYSNDTKSQYRRPIYVRLQAADQEIEYQVGTQAESTEDNV